MRTLALLCVLFVIALPARAADRPQLSQRGCGVAADMVLVARSLSAAGIEREKASEIMALVYVAVSDGGAFDKLREDLADFAYRRKEPPVEVATAFGMLCMERAGALDGVLGTRLRWRF